MGKTKLRQLLPPVGRIGPDLFQAGKERGESGQYTAGPFGIMEIGRGDIHCKQQAKRIDKNMTFAAFHALVPIKPADPGGFLNRLDALCIDDRGARLHVSPHAFAFSTPQGCEQAKPGAFETQPSEMVEHRLPRREVGR